MTRRFVIIVLGVLIAGLNQAPHSLSQTTDERLAIKGYDPVAYFTESRPVLGDPHFEYDWDGALYWFSSARHRDQFKDDPDHYTPQYGNLCTAALARGKRVVSDPKNWIIVNGRLHLFGKPIGPGLMRHDPEGMKARADKNYARVSELPWEEDDQM